MAIGTGLQFDSLRDQKEIGFDKMNGMDVYNFLHMVSSAGRINSNPACLGKEVDLMAVNVYNFLHMVSSVGGTNSNTACLGEEVDDIIEVDEVTDCLT